MAARPTSSPRPSEKLALALGAKTEASRVKFCVSTARLNVLSVCWIEMVAKGEGARGRGVHGEGERRRRRRGRRKERRKVGKGLCIVYFSVGNGSRGYAVVVLFEWVGKYQLCASPTYAFELLFMSEPPVAAGTPSGRIREKSERSTQRGLMPIQHTGWIKAFFAACMLRVRSNPEEGVSTSQRFRFLLSAGWERGADTLRHDADVAKSFFLWQVLRS